ncbi:MULTISPECIES: hypothetical protein [unclassified Minwuia]|uniref:hypothetical protein n=1 Tax=unclassified Minwuia TaxID=2618799 RepID=UPI0024798F40|nr:MULTISPECIES: hypothetical protein [unclassified Minwuia]
MRKKIPALAPLVAWIIVQFLMTWAVAAAPVTVGGSLDQAKFRSLIAAGVQELVICTPSGLKVIDLSDGTAREKSESGGSGCEWCHGFGASVLPAPERVATDVVLTVTGIIMAPARQPACIARPHGIGFSSRAPPLLALHQS